MAVQIQVRRGDAALWTSSNPTLAEGEIGAELDTGRFKIGDGTTAWNSLGYSSDIQVLSIVGSRTYTEQNYVTDGESITASIDALDTNLNLVQSMFEEGAWTPVLKGTTTAGTPTYTTQIGVYVKIGKMIFIHGRLDLASLGGATGNLRIANLPYAAKGSSYIYTGSLEAAAVSFETGYYSAISRLIGGTTEMFLSKQGVNKPTGEITHNELVTPANARFRFSMVYTTD